MTRVLNPATEEVIREVPEASAEETDAAVAAAKSAFPAWRAVAPADRALAVLLGMEPDIDVVAQVRPGDDLAAAAIMCRPEVALVDEVSAVSAVLAEVPECRVLVLATSAHPGHAACRCVAGLDGADQGKAEKRKRKTAATE